MDAAVVRSTGQRLLASTWLLPVAMGLAAALVAGILTFGTGGVRLGSDSPLYLDGAASVLDGGGVPQGASPYAGYVMFLAAVTGLGGGLAAIGSVQVALAGLTAAAVTDVARRRWGTIAALACGLLLLAYLDLWRWYGYVLTDALFVTLVAVAVWAVERAIAGPRRYVALALFVGLAAAAVRPNGWYLTAVAGVALSLMSRDPLTRRILAAVAVIAVVAVGWSFTIDTAASYATPAEMLQDGAVIWGWPPGWIDMPDAGGDRGLIEYVASHPLASIELGARRIVTEVGQVRPYYSRPHNLVIALVLLPMYVLAILGVPRAIRSMTGRLVAVLVASHLAFIAATFADYDGRFLMYVLPLIAALSGAGAASTTVLLHRARTRARRDVSPTAEAHADEA